MAGYEQKDNSGVLFKNDKQGNEKRPDYTGNIMVNGTEMWLSAWIKEGAKGKYMSLSCQSKDKKEAAPEKAEKVKINPEKPFDDFDSDSIPF